MPGGPVRGFRWAAGGRERVTATEARGFPSLSTIFPWTVPVPDWAVRDSAKVVRTARTRKACFNGASSVDRGPPSPSFNYTPVVRVPPIIAKTGLLRLQDVQ